MMENGNVVELKVLTERLTNFIEESSSDRRQIRQEIESMRKQTHDWMQAMLNRLPPWAIAIGSVMTTTMGAMAMWILTHIK